MGCSVSQVFNEFNVKIAGKLAWGDRLDEQGKGIYIVSLSDDPELSVGGRTRVDIDQIAFQTWKRNAPDMTCNGLSAQLKMVELELNRFWFPDENILYIGQTDQSLSTRLGSFYSHIIGRKAPHSGGQWLKALAFLSTLNIYYGVCPNPKAIEFDMLKFFAELITEQEFEKIEQPANKIPFANREIKYNGYCKRKKHKLKRQQV